LQTNMPVSSNLWVGLILGLLLRLLQTGSTKDFCSYPVLASEELPLEMFQPSAAMVSFTEDPTVVRASSIQRRQQVFVQEEVIVSSVGVAQELDRVLLGSQVRNDQKLLELAQYAHDHAIDTAPETEIRLGCHLREYLGGMHAYYDASMKNQGELQSVELGRHLGCLKRDVHEREQASAVATVRTMANKMEKRFGGDGDNIQYHSTTHVSECETRLQSALKQIQGNFESATDLQSAWIEKRLKVKLNAAK
ncbi:hypothetical protein GN958_ATG05121, partial [Phytophthora infestans]